MRQGCALNPREVERIVSLLAGTELTIKEIAQRMHCSRSVVGGINRRCKVREYGGLRATWRKYELSPEPDQQATRHN